MIILVLFICKVIQSNNAVPEFLPVSQTKAQIGLQELRFYRFMLYNIAKIMLHDSLSEIGLKQNSENSIMEFTGFDRFIIGRKVTAVKDAINCSYQESRILRWFQLRLKLKQSVYLNKSAAVTWFDYMFRDGDSEQLML